MKRPTATLLLLLPLAASLATAQRLDDSTKLTAPRGPAAPAPRFLLGYNMGNVRFLPFARAPLNHTADQLRAMIHDALDDMADSGANAVRFWLHIDGSTNPEFGPDGLVSGVSLDTVNDLKWFLQAAYDRGLAVVLSLWSHDILAVRSTNSQANRDRALRIIEDETALDAYIQKALIPLLQDLGGSTLKGAPSGASALDAVWAWETMNEPEGAATDLEFNKNYMYDLADGEYVYENPPVYDAQPKQAVDFQNISFLMEAGGYIEPVEGDASKARYNGPHFLKTEGGKTAGLNEPLYRDVFAQFNSDFSYLENQIRSHNLTTVGTTSDKLARFHNRIAGAIHRAAPGSLVTAAAHSINYVSNRPNLKVEPWRPPARNLYADDVLVSAGGDADGTLDFYQAHTYPVWSDASDEYNARIMPFAQAKSYWQLDKPLLIGEFWNAVGGAGEGSLTADAWYRLFEDGYAGGLGWAYFEVAEEFGGLPHPARTVKKHQMRDAFRPLIRAVADRLASDRRSAAAAAVARPVERPLGRKGGDAVPSTTTSASFGGVAAAATPHKPVTTRHAAYDKKDAAEQEKAAAAAAAAPVVVAAAVSPAVVLAPVPPPSPPLVMTTADTTTSLALTDAVAIDPALADAVADVALALAKERGPAAAATALHTAAEAAALEAVIAGGEVEAAVRAQQAVQMAAMLLASDGVEAEVVAAAAADAAAAPPAVQAPATPPAAPTDDGSAAMFAMAAAGGDADAEIDAVEAVVAADAEIDAVEAVVAADADADAMLDAVQAGVESEILVNDAQTAVEAVANDAAAAAVVAAMEAEATDDDAVEQALADADEEAAIEEAFEAADQTQAAADGAQTLAAVEEAAQLVAASEKAADDAATLAAAEEVATIADAGDEDSAIVDALMQADEEAAIEEALQAADEAQAAADGAQTMAAAAEVATMADASDEAAADAAQAQAAQDAPIEEALMQADEEAAIEEALETADQTQAAAAEVAQITAASDAATDGALTLAAVTDIAANEAAQDAALEDALPLAEEEAEIEEVIASAADADALAPTPPQEAAPTDAAAQQDAAPADVDAVPASVAADADAEADSTGAADAAAAEVASDAAATAADAVAGTPVVAPFEEGAAPMVMARVVAGGGGSVQSDAPADDRPLKLDAAVFESADDDAVRLPE